MQKNNLQPHQKIDKINKSLICVEPAPFYLSIHRFLSFPPYFSSSPFFFSLPLSLSLLLFLYLSLPSLPLHLHLPVPISLIFSTPPPLPRIHSPHQHLINKNFQSQCNEYCMECLYSIFMCQIRKHVVLLVGSIYSFLLLFSFSTWRKCTT